MSVMYEHERKARTTSRLQHIMVRLFATESPWTLWHTGGSRQDTHGTPVPKQGRPWVARQAPRHDDRPHDKDKSQDKRALRKQVQKCTCKPYTERN